MEIRGQILEGWASLLVRERPDRPTMTGSTATCWNPVQRLHSGCPVWGDYVRPPGWIVRVFDPGATDGSGHSYYQPILAIQQAAPVQSFVPGDSSGRWSSGNLWTPTVVDAGFYNRFPVNTPPSQIVIAVPPFSAVAFPVATEMHFRQAGTTGLFVQPQGGVQVVTPQGLLQMTDRFGATFTLKNVAQDLWELFGYLEPGSP